MLSQFLVLLTTEKSPRRWISLTEGSKKGSRWKLLKNIVLIWFLIIQKVTSRFIESFQTCNILIWPLIHVAVFCTFYNTKIFLILLGTSAFGNEPVSRAIIFELLCWYTVYFTLFLQLRFSIYHKFMHP